jgi:hypothetical protein
MRASFFFLIFSALPALGQTETNIACVERLDVPTYPVPAKQARIAGVLTATVFLGSDAFVGRISTEWISTFKKGDMFQTAVEQSIRVSTFSKSCTGKKVTLVFNFVIAEGGRSQEDRFSFGYPSQFWITAPQMMVQP